MHNQIKVECVSCGKDMKFISEVVPGVLGFLCEECIHSVRVCYSNNEKQPILKRIWEYFCYKIRQLSINPVFEHQVKG